ncbi:proton-coupled amino acid transporter 1-like isoform X2 [Montipora foliosa]|uniref:proton-coupled amino acid transporter 1-like isoform X2 n=1 Tax=Montipora foliosa TaxID=591990 RepID=UPI0035F17345
MNTVVQRLGKRCKHDWLLICIIQVISSRYCELGVIGLLVIAIITDHCCQLIIKCKNAAVEMVLHSSSKYQVLQTEACYEEMEKVKETIEKEMTLGDIGNIAIGPWGYRIVNIALVITQTGFCTAYFIFIGNTIAEMFPLSYKAQILAHLKPSTNGTLFVLLLLIPLPFLVLMAYTRSIRKLGPISGIANVTLLAGFLGLLAFLLHGFHFKPKDVTFFKWFTFPVFFGQLTGAYEGIGTVIPIESSMAENRPRFPLYLHLTIAMVSVILGSFGMLGYMIYGSDVPQIVTNTLQTDFLAQIIRITLVIAVAMTYPLQLYPVIEIMESIFFTKVHSRSKSHLDRLIAGPSIATSENPNIGVSNSSIEPYFSGSYHSTGASEPASASNDPETEVLLPNDSEILQYKTAAWKRNLLRTALVLITAGIAVLLKDEFAYVNALIGSLGSSVLAYILPCTFHLVLFKNTNSVCVVIKDIVFILFGVVGGVVGVVITVENIFKHLHY